MVTNLVGNAIKFTTEGGVLISTRLVQHKVSSQLIVDVADTGIGMTPEQLEKIFDAFVQADTSITRRFGGTGLGLAISKKIVEALGGELKVTSEVGKGTVFSAVINAGDVSDKKRITFKEYLNSEKSESKTQNLKQVNLGRRNVLVVDDGESNRRLVRLILERAGCVVTEAVDGQDAVEKTMSGDFEIILMDMQMPVMDGYQATSKLRQMNFDGPIIALTANVMKDDEKKCMEHGCTGFVPKPINMDLLVQTMAELLEIDLELVPTQTGENESLEAEFNVKSEIDTIAAEVNSAVSVAPKTAHRPQLDSETLMSLPQKIESTLPMDEPEFVEIVREFTITLRSKLDEMGVAADAGDHTELAGLAHWLKGAGGTCGFNEFFEPALALEKLAKSEQTAEYGKAIQVLELLSKAIVVEPDSSGSIT